MNVQLVRERVGNLKGYIANLEQNDNRKAGRWAMQCVKLIHEAYDMFPKEGDNLPTEIDDKLILAQRECTGFAQNEYVKHIGSELTGILADLKGVRKHNTSDLPGSLVRVEADLLQMRALVEVL